MTAKSRLFCIFNYTIFLFMLYGCNAEQPLKSKIPVTMTVASNISNTDFYYREQKSTQLGNEGWVHAGKGTRSDLLLFKGGRYEIKAVPQNYYEKKQRFHEPERFYEFTFYDADRKTNLAASASVPPSPPVPIDQQALVNGIEKSQAVSGKIGNKFAVVIGVSKYQNNSQEGISKLLYADEDAKAFAEYLKGNGWNSDFVKVLTNEQATKKNVEITLESWLTKAGRDDLVVLFWSGHGFPDPDDPEKVYYACYDTDPRIPATGYRMDKIRQALEELHCRNVLILADTCYAGNISRGNEKAITLTYVENTAKIKDVPEGWIFMLSSDVNRTSIENTSWSHGAFTYCLLKALSGEADGFQSAGPKDGTVTMGELHVYLRTTMPDETQKILGVAKHPVITASTGDPDIWDITLGGE